jgi:hypothetical protein
MANICGKGQKWSANTKRGQQMQLKAPEDFLNSLITLHFVERAKKACEGQQGHGGIKNRKS